MLSRRRRRWLGIGLLTLTSAVSWGGGGEQFFSSNPSKLIIILCINHGSLYPAHHTNVVFNLFYY